MYSANLFADLNKLAANKFAEYVYFDGFKTFINPSKCTSLTGT